VNQDQGLLGHVTGEWGVSGNSLYQTSIPSVVNRVRGRQDAHISGTGNYLADGQNNLDFPNVIIAPNLELRSAGSPPALLPQLAIA
jgi:hypothetical protein